MGHATKLGVRGSVGASSCLDSPLTKIADLQDDLRHVTRFAVYEALWRVGWRASDFEGDTSRTLEIERLASKLFVDHLRTLELQTEGKTAKLRLGFGVTTVKVQKVEGGFVLARVELPEGTQITASTPDNSVALTLAYENFEVFVDSRYFLLQERMNAFAKLGDVHWTWQWAEYAAAWVQVPSGKVCLSGQLSREFFELAWMKHEYQTFGSVDYLGTGLELGGLLDPSLSAALQNIESRLLITKERIELERDNLENQGIGRQLVDDALAAIENGLHKLPSTSTCSEVNSLLAILPKNASSIHPDLTRAQLYAIAPPCPINLELGLSVLRELEIERVGYRRRDPMGWVSTLATPIYIPIIDVTIWFAEVEVSLEFERKPIEQIYDFNHQTLPRPLLEDEVGLVRIHKALTYRYELPIERMSFSLYIVWPWAFSVEVS